jgi:hypothetical protein
VYAGLTHSIYPSIYLCAEASPIDTLQAQLSGYGADHRLIVRFYARALEAMGGRPLETWTHDDLPAVVHAFLDVRFPTVVVRAAPRGSKGVCLSV